MNFNYMPQGLGTIVGDEIGTKSASPSAHAGLLPTWAGGAVP